MIRSFQGTILASIITHHPEKDTRTLLLDLVFVCPAPLEANQQRYTRERKETAMPKIPC